MAEFLLELLSEEIPAGMQTRAADDLKRLVTEKLKEAGLTFDSAEAYSTPRRLTLVVGGLPEQQPDVREERKGPRADAPDKAVQGFLKSVGLTRDQLEERETKKGTVLFAVIERKGRPTAEVLPDLVKDTLHKFPWHKSMRWGDSQLYFDEVEMMFDDVKGTFDEGVTFKWARPLGGLLAVLDEEALTGSLITGHNRALKFSATTTGHRFHAPEAFQVKDFADYREKLRKAHVILDAAERRDIISTGAGELAAKEGLTVIEDGALLDEVAGLVEWPVVLMGEIDAEFMGVPREVLTATMRGNQKYFSLQDKSGNLAPRFIVVANLDAKDGGAAIVAGNERVLRARLADAKFFWDQDRKRTLASRAPELAQIVFHAKLGSVDQKMDRVQALATSIADAIPGADKDRVRSAARLAKADLVTGMVYEFPEVQGIMGRYYALEDGEHEEVAAAIAEHYSPVGPNDDCPSAPVSVAVALADKIDSLVGFFAIDEKPTGSKDPFALRRAALGVIRLILENKLSMNLRETMVTAFNSYLPLFRQHGSGNISVHASEKFIKDQERFWLLHESDGREVAGDLMDFIADRLKVHLRDQGVRHDHIAAVFALTGEDDLLRLLARVEALRAFLDQEDGANLLTAYRRAANIVRIEEKKDGAAYAGETDRGLLSQDEESALLRALGDVRGAVEKNLREEQFVDAMMALSHLRGPVDAFFDHVTVNCDDADLRRNRLLLLSQIRSALDSVADFSQIEG